MTSELTTNQRRAIALLMREAARAVEPGQIATALDTDDDATIDTALEEIREASITIGLGGGR